jgi:hypothetical protein
VEVNLAPAAWRKSRRSGQAQNCVEVAANLPGAVGVRDSKDPGGQPLVFTRREWRAFVSQVKTGTFDQR